MGSAALLSCTERPTVATLKPSVEQLASAVTPPELVISQIYGGGGNAGATLKNDFIEIFNPGATAVTVTGWSVQYASVTGNSWQVTTLTGSIPAGGYYLVREAAGAGGTVDLPAFDATGGIAMAATAGKVVLTRQTAAYTVACPSGGNVVDFVPFGTNANAGTCTNQTATIANATAAIRKGAGCTYTGSNTADFEVLAPAPRNSATTVSPCNVTPPPPPPPRVLTSVVVTPTSMLVGSTQQLIASAKDQDGQPMNPQPTFAWTSDNESKVFVEPGSGVATALAIGSANVTATAGGKSASAPVEVINPPSIIITEMLANPLGSAELDAEWIEIYNGEATPVNLAGYKITSGASSGIDSHTITALIVPAHACVVLAGSSDPTKNGGITGAYATGGNIVLNNNNTDWVSIRTPSGAMIDSVAYAIRPDGVNPNNFQPFAGAANETFSYELKFLAIDNTTIESGNWAKASNVFSPSIHGTPGTCPPLAQVFTSVTVAATAVNKGGTKQLVATARDQNGNAMFTQPSFTWTSANELILTVDAGTGMASGVDLGTASVTATSDGKSGSATITVVDPDAIGTLFLSMNDPKTIPVGYVKPTFPTAQRTDGSAVANPVLTYSSSNESVATVDAQGYVTALSTGAVTITATAKSGVTGHVNVTIIEHTIATSAVYRDHVNFGTPVDGNPNDDLILERDQYVLSYNATRGGPNWVSWNLNASQFGGAPRCDCFSPDLTLPNAVYRVVDADFRNSGYDRGHIVQSEERTQTLQENATTFILTNILPQFAENNQGPWSKFENYLNDLARTDGKEIYVIAGGQWAASPPTLKGEGKVAIPDYTWKIAVILGGGQSITSVHNHQDLQVIAVRMPNLASTALGIRNNPWEMYKVKVRDIEQATGYNFLAALVDSVENIVETDDKPPVARAGGSYSGSEGAAIQLDASASTDPDAGDVLTYVWSFGDGSSATTSDPRPTHTYANNGSYTLTLTVYDVAGASSRVSTSVAVANVAPSVGAFTGATLLPGETYSASGTFADPGDDSWSATVNYGEGATAALPLSGMSFSLSHTYTTAGNYSVTVVVSDGDGSGTRSGAVTVLTPSQMLVNVRAATTENSLRVKLDAALKSLDKGNTTPAMNQLEAFLHEVDAMVQSGRLASATADAWTESITRVIRSLNR